MLEYDYVVVGGGMAGCSVAYFLSETARVVVLEGEAQPGYHATGRSAASFTTVYGNATIRRLTMGAQRFFAMPPQGFAEAPVLAPLGALFFADASQLPRLDALLDEVADPARLARLSGDEVRARVSILGPQVVAGAYEPGARAIDVHGLQQGFIRGLRARGGELRTDARVRALAHDGRAWTVDTDVGRFRAPVVVNAAGAWADMLAERADVAPLGLRPLRRSALTFRPPTGVAIADWPITIDIDEQFYFKPEAGLLMLTGCDEVPSEPCDAQPEEIELAQAIDRFERATTVKVPRIEHKWAGLRTFTADRTPVAGYDDRAEGFFWLAGQGGYGIQTSPALGRLAACIARRQPIPADLADVGLTTDDLAVARLRDGERGRAVRSGKTLGAGRA